MSKNQCYVLHLSLSVGVYMHELQKVYNMCTNSQWHQQSVLLFQDREVKYQGHQPSLSTETSYATTLNEQPYDCQT